MEKPVAQTPSSVNTNTPSSVNTNTEVAQTPSSVNTNTATSVNTNTEVAQTPSSVNEFIKRKRNLPHWQLPGSVYFITFRTYNNKILDDTSKQIIYDNIVFYSKKLYKLYSFVVMPDHVHIILKPNEIFNNSFVDLSKIMQSIKGFAAKQIIKYETQTRASELPVKKIFQSESFDRIIRNDDELLEKLTYILNNPIKRGLVDNGYNYQWFYLNEDLN